MVCGVCYTAFAMSAKLKQWGAILVVYGLIALVLPAVTGMQLRIFNLFGENSRAAAFAAVVIGAVIWFLGTMGSSGSPEQAAATPAGSPPPLPPDENATMSSHTCGKCGAVAAADDRFCMQCGAPLATAVTTPPPVAGTSNVPGKQSSGCSKGCLVLLLLIAVGVGWIFFGGSFGNYSAPPRSDPAIPQRMAGTLTEFPVDPAATNRMEPTNVITQSFEPAANGSKPTEVVAPANSFPPGINTSTIPQVATNMTSTTYRSDPTSAPTNIHVLQGAAPGAASQFAQGVAQSSGGQVQSTRVQSPLGQTYDGYSVRSPTILVFILTNRNTGNIIVLYTPQASGFEATQRLAGSVGNGRGIRDYPKIVDTFGALPATPPPGYSMTNMLNFTGNELTASLNQAQSGLDPQVAKALGQILQAIRLLIPERGTMTQYRNSQRQEKGVLIANYGSRRKASAAYRLLRWTFGLTMKSTKTAGFEALQYGDSNTKVMVFQKGPYIGLSMTPGSSSDEELAALARSLQF